MLHKNSLKLFLKQARYILVAALFLVSGGASYAQAALGVPKVLNYQGRLLNASGDLQGTSSGTDYCFKFSFYSSATVGQGSKLWPAGDPSIMTINVKSGVFIASIGAGGDALNFNFQDTDSVYLNVEVRAQSGGLCPATGYDTLGPRQRIVSSGYAINASTVLGAGYSAMGTTTPAVNTVLTVEATSTTAIPLTIKAYGGQQANLLNIQDASSNHLFSINSSGGIFASSTLLVGAAGAAPFIIDSNGNVGVGTLTASRKFNVFETNSNPQLRISQTGSVYGEFYIDSAGDMRISTTGGNVRLNNENIYVCSGGSCGASAPAGEEGNVVVETAVILNNKFQLRQINASTTIMCDSVMADCDTSHAILEFDEAAQ